MITYSRYRRGYGDDGTIAALACIEGMASAHDLAILGVFTLTAPTNTWGPTTSGGDFLYAAVPLVAAYLIERPS